MRVQALIPILIFVSVLLIVKGVDLCTRRPTAPLIRFRYFRLTSDNLKGDYAVRDLASSRLSCCCRY